MSARLSAPLSSVCPSVCPSAAVSGLCHAVEPCIGSYEGSRYHLKGVMGKTGNCGGCLLSYTIININCWFTVGCYMFYLLSFLRQLRQGYTPDHRLVSTGGVGIPSPNAQRITENHRDSLQLRAQGNDDDNQRIISISPFVE